MVEPVVHAAATKRRWGSKSWWSLTLFQAVVGLKRQACQGTFPSLDRRTPGKLMRTRVTAGEAGFSVAYIPGSESDESHVGVTFKRL
jgi:hypothetical protein